MSLWEKLRADTCGVEEALSKVDLMGIFGQELSHENGQVLQTIKMTPVES